MQVLAKQKQSGKDRKNNSPSANQKTNDSGYRRIMTFGYAAPGIRKKNLNPATSHIITQQLFSPDLNKIPLFSRQTTGIQPKLKINRPNDKFEQEADKMADQVMRMPQNNPIQRKPKKHTEEEEHKIQMKPLASQITPLIHRKLKKEEDEQAKKLIQTKADGRNRIITTSFQNLLNKTKGAGHRLPESTNRFMSNAFGADFGKVRIHTGKIAGKLNQIIQAKAFTHGSDIYFNAENYSPFTISGKRLLAHELTHTIQQSAITKEKPEIPQIQRAGEEKVSKGVKQFIEHLENGDEDLAISILSTLNSNDKDTILKDRGKIFKLALGKFNNKEMFLAVSAMNQDLFNSLVWLLVEGTNWKRLHAILNQINDPKGR